MFVGYLEKAIVKLVAWILANKGLADVDGDGDVDFDDVWATYKMVREVIADGKTYFADWDNLSRGGRIDAVVSYMKGTTGQALKGCVIAVLETVAWVVMWLSNQDKPETPSLKANPEAPAPSPKANPAAGDASA